MEHFMSELHHTEGLQIKLKKLKKWRAHLLGSVFLKLVLDVSSEFKLTLATLYMLFIGFEEVYTPETASHNLYLK